VLVSALFWSGPESTVVESVETGIVEGYISPPIIDELNRVLRYPNFGLAGEEVEDALNYYITVLVLVRPESRLDVVKDDPEDNKVLECALEAHADFIVTGDNHLLRIHEYRGIRTVRASEFLEILKQTVAS